MVGERRQGGQGVAQGLAAVNGMDQWTREVVLARIVAPGVYPCTYDTKKWGVFSSCGKEERRSILLSSGAVEVLTYFCFFRRTCVGIGVRFEVFTRPGMSIFDLAHEEDRSSSSSSAVRVFVRSAPRSDGEDEGVRGMIGRRCRNSCHLWG